MALFYASAVSAVKSMRKQAGFTLVELLVVIAILGVLAVTLILVFDPAAQINKAQNATRQHDLTQIQTSLDTYYDDMGCYPTRFTFGQPFIVNSKVYMEKVPEDPKCQADGTNCYVYQTDTSSTCPQWNILYTKLGQPVAHSCPLAAKQCVPQNYQSLGLNYCTFSGSIDCSKASSVNVTPEP